ncbi:MAG: hypothetical protein AVDCRST_MAG26-907, partial [uncultured Chloroflexia bacterium]
GRYSGSRCRIQSRRRGSGDRKLAAGGVPAGRHFADHRAQGRFRGVGARRRSDRTGRQRCSGRRCQGRGDWSDHGSGRRGGHTSDPCHWAGGWMGNLTGLVRRERRVRRRSVRRVLGRGCLRRGDQPLRHGAARRARYNQCNRRGHRRSETGRRGADRGWRDQCQLLYGGAKRQGRGYTGRARNSEI